MLDIALPESRREAILRNFPESGSQWIAEFPDKIDRCRTLWHLTLLESVTIGWPTNMIYFAENDRGANRVLKIGHPHTELGTESTTLKLYDGKSAVRLVDSDETVGVLLLERITPGTTLREVASDEANIASAVNLMQKLPRKLPAEEMRSSKLPEYRQWIERAFAEFREKNPQQSEFLTYIVAAERAFQQICSKSDDNYLLHGDLHHENILLDEKDGWLAIDPKGVFGPRIMECGRFLHNFMQDEITVISSVSEAKIDDLCAVLERRYRLLSGVLGFEVSDLALVTLIDATLGTCWTINSREAAENGLQVVKATYQLSNRLNDLSEG